MTVEVGDLANQTKPEPNLHLKVTNRCVQRMVHVIRNVSTKGPVVSTVPEHVPDRRSCVAEPVDEERFHDTFEVVKAPVVHSVGLDRVDHTVFSVAEVFVNREVVEDRVDQERAEVLEEEERAVRDLCSQVFEDYG